MSKVIGEKIASLPALDTKDMFIVGAVKVVEEKLIAMTPLGNGNFVSGGAKLIGGMLLPEKKFTRHLKHALVIDGVEDVLQNVFAITGLNDAIDKFAGKGKSSSESPAMLVV